MSNCHDVADWRLTTQAVQRRYPELVYRGSIMFNREAFRPLHERSSTWFTHMSIACTYTRNLSKGRGKIDTFWKHVDELDMNG